VPALILKADASPEHRQTHEQAASVMPNGRLVHIAGGGHNLHHDEPERTVEVLNEFLSSSVSSPFKHSLDPREAFGERPNLSGTK